MAGRIGPWGGKCGIGERKTVSCKAADYENIK